MSVYQARIITKLTDLNDWSEKGMITQQTLILNQSGDIRFSEEKLVDIKEAEGDEEKVFQTETVHEQAGTILESKARELLDLLEKAAESRHFRYRADGTADGKDTDLIGNEPGWMLTLYDTDGKTVSVGSKDMEGLTVDGISVGQRIRRAIPLSNLCLFGEVKPEQSGKIAKARIRTQLASPADVEDGKVMDEELTIDRDGEADWLEHVFLAPEDEMYAWLCGKLASQRENEVRIGARAAREVLDMLSNLPDRRATVDEEEPVPIWQVDLLDENGYTRTVSAPRTEAFDMGDIHPSSFIRERIPIEGMTLFDPVSRPSIFGLI